MKNVTTFSKSVESGLDPCLRLLEKRKQTGKKVLSHCGKQKRLRHWNREGRKWGLYTATRQSTLYFVSLLGIVLDLYYFLLLVSLAFTSIKKVSKDGENNSGRNGFFSSFPHPTCLLTMYTA